MRLPCVAIPTTAGEPSLLLSRSDSTPDIGVADAFFRYEQLFQSALSDDEVRELLARGLALEQRAPGSGLDQKARSKCDFNPDAGSARAHNSFKHVSAQHSSLLRVKRMLDPWYAEMLRLVSEFQARRGLCCL